MVYVEEKVRKQHAFNVNDGKDKYLHHTKAKGRKFFFFFFNKTACQTSQFCLKDD